MYVHVYEKHNVIIKIARLYHPTCGTYYRSVPGKHPCTTFREATVAASTQTYAIMIPGKRPRARGPKLRVMFKRPCPVDTTVCVLGVHVHVCVCGGGGGHTYIIL